MKQTQTKLFDFSDVGLDFCAGSKNLFPDRFKKMLSLGYNEQTTSSVAVTGNQVVLTYGVSHGYVADRVLKITSGTLATINDGEFWIDSVTTNTVTLTIDNAPASISGGFTTRIASLGWSLEYENANVHIYKFKHIDETDMFIRFVFQNNAAYRNTVSVCVGKTADLALGTITDENSIEANRANITPVAAPNWEFSYINNNTFNNYTYTQGLATFGLGRVVGSKYHFVAIFNCISQIASTRICGVFPFVPVYGYSALDYPALMLEETTNAINTNLNSAYGLLHTRVYVGKNRCMGDQVRANYTVNTRFYQNASTARAWQSFTTQDTFNTSVAQPMPIYESPSDQFLGYLMGIYACSFDATNTPPIANNLNPSITTDIDLNNLIVIGLLSRSTTADGVNFFAIPIEEIKIAN